MTRSRRGRGARIARRRSHARATGSRSDRVLVAIGPDAQAEQLVRAGKRIADALDAEWTVVYVETPALLRLSDSERNRRIDLLRLAESLGAETVTLDGPSAAAALIEYAQTRNATRVIVGAPKRRGWRALLRPLDGDCTCCSAPGVRRHHDRRDRRAVAGRRRRSERPREYAQPIALEALCLRLPRSRPPARPSRSACIRTSSCRIS